MEKTDNRRIPDIQYELEVKKGFLDCEGLFFRREESVKKYSSQYLLIAGKDVNATENRPFWEQEGFYVLWKERPDAYAMEINEQGIILESCTERGFFYGLRTLKKWKKQYKQKLPFVKLIDWADVEVRCDYLEFRNFHPKIENIYQYLEDMADRHINAVLVEMEDKRPFLNSELKKLQDEENGFGVEQVKKLQEKAKELYIEWIPLQQSFGHLEYVLKYPEYRALRELPESAGELCPMKKESVKLAQKLLGDINQLFPESSYLHLGCDEVWSLLKCDICKKSGMSSVQMFIQYVNQLIDYVCGLGKIPLFWHDMLISGTTEELRELDKRAIVVVWMYDGNDLEKKASEFIKKLEEAGITIWGACAVRCWDKSGFQNYPVLKNRKNNIIQWAKVCKKHKLKGMVNTNWSAYSALAHPYGIYETSIYTSTFAASKSWNYKCREEEFLGKYLWEHHKIDPEEILDCGMQFEDYYQVAAKLDRDAIETGIYWEEREADWYRVIEEYENLTLGDFPAVLQMFRVAKFPERSEEWDSMRQRYLHTFEGLKKLYPEMKKVLEKYMKPEQGEIYLYAKYYLWELYEKEILRMAEETEIEGFYPILTE